MKGSRRIGTTSSTSGNFREWITAYFRTRAHLANYKSEFLCDPACTRPGCKNQDLQVPVTLVDLIGAAQHRSESVSAMYRSSYTLSLHSGDRQDWIRAVSLRLKKPCPFLEGELCSIYPLRPLPCILFPEGLVVDGTLQEYEDKAQFGDYLCLQRHIYLSPERTEVIQKLRQMWEREWLISSFYLFHYSPFYLDFSNLKKKLLQKASNLNLARPHERKESERSILSQAFEHIFLDLIAKCPPFAEVAEKIHALDGLQEQKHLFQLLQNDMLFEELTRAGDGRILVFRFINGKLRGGWLY